MRAVEGSLLVVDSTQGVEAQTLANVYHAIEADHEIVPVLNKIDLPRYCRHTGIHRPRLACPKRGRHRSAQGNAGGFMVR